ncbi:19237_t:CDS:2 [Funneliformis geosporum]|nr:19237_t:CDS:2 [Funneliformis geosporum]
MHIMKFKNYKAMENVLYYFVKNLEADSDPVENNIINKKTQYDHAQTVWEKVECKTFGDYHDLYLRTDVLILVDSIQKFRTTMKEVSGLDPLNYITLPSFAFDMLKKMTKIKLELFHKEMKGYNKHNANKWLLYLDANNLYGWVILQYLPTGGSCAWEVKLKYPDYLYQIHTEYPLCLERRIVKCQEFGPHQNNDLIDILSGGKFAETEKLLNDNEKRQKILQEFRNSDFQNVVSAIDKTHIILINKPPKGPEWTSGNEDIDGFLKGTLLYVQQIEWIKSNILEKVKYEKEVKVHPIARSIYEWIVNNSLGKSSVLSEYCLNEITREENLRTCMPEFNWYTKLNMLNDIIIELTKLHDSNLIHRDLCTSSILTKRVRNNYNGLELNQYFISQITSKNDNILSFIAPEVLEGKPYTTASNVYSFSMIMWELVTGIPPFNDRTRDLQLICKGDRHYQKFPQCYADLMNACWEPDPSERPTAIEVSTIIQSWIYYILKYYKADSPLDIKQFVDCKLIDENIDEIIEEIDDFQFRKDTVEFWKADKALAKVRAE